MNCYIILFPDFSYQIYPRQMDLSTFQDGSKQYAIDGLTPVLEIPEWISRIHIQNETKYIQEVSDTPETVEEDIERRR